MVSLSSAKISSSEPTQQHKHLGSLLTSRSFMNLKSMNCVSISPQQSTVALFFLKRIPCPVTRHSVVATQQGQHSYTVYNECTVYYEERETHLEAECSTVLMVCKIQYWCGSGPQSLTPVSISLVFLE